MQKRDFNPKQTLFLALILIAFAAYTMTRTPPQQTKSVLSGSTMGTTWQAVINGELSQSEADSLSSELTELFTQIDKQMSGWNPSSDVTVFNNGPADHPFKLADHFYEVLHYSLALSGTTEGAFDITVKPLLDLWGFGAGSKPISVPPGEPEVSAALEQCGYQKLVLDESSRTLSKRSDAIHVELSATAKGYAVDKAADLIVNAGYPDCLFEIGGEFAARGNSPRGTPWRLGISTPDMDDSVLGNSLQAAVNMDNTSMATSGDYQNYFKHGTNIYSHVIDPRTGKPAAHGVASATVIAPKCMHADGLATAMMVMGAQDGLALIESLPDTEAMIISRSGRHSYTHHFSSGFEKLLKVSP